MTLVTLVPNHPLYDFCNYIFSKINHESNCIHAVHLLYRIDERHQRAMKMVQIEVQHGLKQEALPQPFGKDMDNMLGTSLPNNSYYTKHYISVHQITSKKHVHFCSERASVPLANT